MGSLSLLQGIFPTQELNWGLLHCRWILAGKPNQNHMRYQSISTRIAIIKEKKKHVLASLRPSHSTIGDIKWFSHSGKVEKCLGVSQKVKYGITMQPNNSKYNLKKSKTGTQTYGFTRGFDPWVRKMSWRRKWQLTLVFLPGKSQGQRILVGWSCREMDMTQRLSTANYGALKHIHINPYLQQHC